MANLKRVLSRLRVQSAAGPSGLSYAILLSASPEFLEVCLAFCNLFLRFGGLGPQQWRHSDITAIPKSSEVGQGIDASRPIGLMEVLGKVVMSWLDKQVTQVWRRHKILSPYQFGFQRHRGVCEAARMVFDLILLIKADGQVIWGCLSDVKAAFPSVPGFAWNRAYARVRLPSWIRGCFNFNESGCRARVSTAHGYTSMYDVPPVGATQGAADSPSKFLCHIDVLLRFLTDEGRAHGVRVSLPDGWHRVSFDGEEGDILVDGGVIVASAFADDLLLLAGSYSGLQALLELVQVFYRYIGGQVVPHKSYWFTTASDSELASMPLTLEVLADFGLTQPQGPPLRDGRLSLCRRLAMELSVQAWCEYHELPHLIRLGSASGERDGADGTVVTRVTLELPAAGYSLRSQSYAQLVRTLVSSPPVLDGVVLQFRLATPPPHLPCYRESAPAHLLGYPLGSPLPLTPLGLLSSTRYLGFLLDAGISFGDQMVRIRDRVQDDCAATKRTARSVAEASILLNGFAGGAVGFLAGGVPLSVEDCRPLEAHVATALGVCGRNQHKVSGAQLREPAPVGVNTFCLSARVTETSVTTAIRVLNSTGRPESSTAMAALLGEGRRLGFLSNPLLRPGCFSASSQSYWGAVASWLGVYEWTIRLPGWAVEWSSDFDTDVPLERVWEAVHAGAIRPHSADGLARYTAAQLRGAMEYAGKRRWLFLSQCVATSLRPWSMAAVHRGAQGSGAVSSPGWPVACARQPPSRDGWSHAPLYAHRGHLRTRSALHPVAMCYL